MAPTVTNDGYAPCKRVPPDSVISIEHPGIVKNIDRAVASLGGEERLGQYLHDGPEERAERNLKFNLRPDDPFRIGIDAATAPVSNLVVRVSVPKRTGRKRKRGSSGPFVHDDELASCLQPSLKTPDLLRAMRDNADAYEVHVVGQSSESHRFRKLPDFQFSVMQSSIAHRLKDYMLPYDYDKLVNFHLDPVTGGCQPSEDLVPPPKFSLLDVPFNYLYLDNPGVKQVNGEDGKLERKLRSAKSRSRMHVLSADAPTVPTAPLPECQPEESLAPHFKKILRELRALLDERPIVTRRAALNLLTHDYAYDLRHTVQYCSYIFKSGPFKDAYCKFGIDPRKDPEMRKYQTLVFQLKKRGRPDAFGKDTKWSFSSKGQAAIPRAERNSQSHLFDGITPPATDGKTYQICDITDPVLSRFLAQAPVRAEFDPGIEGWFHNGTWATLRIVVKDKIEALQNGLMPDNGEYERLFAMPSILTDNTPSNSTLTADRGTKFSLLSSQIRAAAMSGRYRVSLRDRATGGRTLGGAGMVEGMINDPAPSPNLDEVNINDDEVGEIEDDEALSEDEADEDMEDDG